MASKIEEEGLNMSVSLPRKHMRWWDEMMPVEKFGKNPKRFYSLLQAYYEYKHSDKEVLDVSLASNIPDFIFSDQREKQIYYYLRSNPKFATFIYKKYPDHKEFLEWMCNSLSPLYLPKVKKQLELPMKVYDLENEIKTLSRTVENKTNDRNNLIDEINKLETEYNEIEKKSKSTKINLEELETQITNLHGKKGLEKIIKYLDQTMRFIEDTYSDPDNKTPTEITGTGMKARFSIDKERFKEIKTQAENIKYYLKSDEFTNEDIQNSKTELSKIREQIILETEQASRELELTKYMNPSKKLTKITLGLMDNIKFLKTKAKKVGNDFLIPLYGFNGLVENLSDIQVTLGDLLSQIKNKEEEK